MSDTRRKKHGERTVVRGLAFCSIAADSNSVQVECDDGKIVRIRPLHYDWKYPDLKPVEDEGPRQDLLSVDEVSHPSLQPRLQEPGLFPQPSPLSPQEGGLGPERREESAEPRNQQVQAHLLG